MGHDDSLYPLERILATAEAASSLKTDETTLTQLEKAMWDSDSAVRYWAAQGFLMRREKGISVARQSLLQALQDRSPNVRIMAAQALGQYGSKEDISKALPVLMELASPEENGIYLSMLALNALDAMDNRAQSIRSQIEQLPTSDPEANNRMRAYVSNLVKKILADIDGK
jgi:uncharacterized sulfatase